MVGRLIGKVDTRLLLAIGLLLDGLGDVRHDRLDARRLAVDDHRHRLRAGRGARLPVRAADDDHLRDAAGASPRRGTGLYSLSRNIGSSVGISIVTCC